MARQGLPKKYAKMGFKKGWAAFKRAQNQRKSKSRPKPRAKPKAQRSVRYVAKKKKKSSRRSSNKMAGMAKYVGAGVYGALRERLSTALDPISQKVPLGAIADEATMLGALYLGDKVIGRKVPLVRDVAKAGMLIEAARIGETLARGQLNFGFSSQGGGNGDIIG